MTLLHAVTPGEETACDNSLLQALSGQLERDINSQLEAGKLTRLEANPEEVEQGLAKLVLTLVDFLRQLMERQAVRRVAAGGLADNDIERMGDTFIRLEARIQELKLVFGLQNEELNLNLGPLGNLM
jgi:hypothetical protein